MYRVFLVDCYLFLNEGVVYFYSVLGRFRRWFWNVDFIFVFFRCLVYFRLVDFIGVGVSRVMGFE